MVTFWPSLEEQHIAMPFWENHIAPAGQRPPATVRRPRKAHGLRDFGDDSAGTAKAVISAAEDKEVALNISNQAC